ncbi:hypothetical protein HZB00_03585 [Candidatus Woesearchaeota archaeon]|nr:hypothetical protein [Candidatus Woesearchaeota archaeon]
MAVASSQSLTTISATETPTNVEYENVITLTANVITSNEISRVTLTVDWLNYTMAATAIPNQFQVSLDTIGNLAALGQATYPYTITVEDVLGNTATYSDSFDVILPAVY